MMEFLKIVSGGCIVFAICFTIICMLDIPAYLKRLNKKSIYEFDCNLDGVRQHITVLEKFQHHFGVETFRRLRVEYVMENDIDGICYGAYEKIANEQEYVMYLKHSINKED
ncbi:MAG: hypothetical protein IJZ39_07100 [Oscillospiraceae bacterium]|nr:hypothetical protein [Oscillospiraceae bacterium]